MMLRIRSSRIVCRECSFLPSLVRQAICSTHTGQNEGTHLSEAQRTAGSGRTCRLVVVGDVHDAWTRRDEAALKNLNPDMVLFVGDFGNEAVQLVAEVASLDTPKAVILGNHDAWYTMSPKPRKRPLAQTLSAVEMLVGMAGPWRFATAQARQQQAHVDGAETAGSEAEAEGPEATGNDSDREPDSSSEGAGANSSSVPGGAGGPQVDLSGVQAQLQLLGSAHVGFSSLPVPGHPLAVIGGRPFSKGGGVEKFAEFYQRLYGVSTVEQYADLVVQAGRQAAGQGQALVLLAHSGPSGLGKAPFSICGIDWKTGAGDHGDVDLEDAIRRLHEADVKLPLVCFGHMHHVLKGGIGFRQMVHVDEEHGTVYLNAATVPRVRKPALARGNSKLKHGSKSSGRRRREAAAPHAAPVPLGGLIDAEGTVSQHHFMLVELDSEGQAVRTARDVWVAVEPRRLASRSPGAEERERVPGVQVAEEHEVFRRVDGLAGPTCSFFDASLGRTVNKKLGPRVHLVQ